MKIWRAFLIAALAWVVLGTLPAASQTIVVASCPAVTPFAGAGQRGLPYAIDINGNVCVIGSEAITGATSNVSSGVTTSSTNVPTVSYNYGFNGTTWDQLQVDASKFLKVIAQTGSTTAITAASGSLASGAMAAGSMVDFLTTRGTKAAGVAAANSLLIGGAYSATPPTLTDGQQVAAQVSIKGGLLLGGAGYPAGATPITISGTGTTGATTATLATGGSVTTYICGFSIRANATAAATGNATVTGTITGTLNFTQWTAPNASGLGVTEMIFTPCVPASAVNTGIAVISAAPGTGGVVSVTAWGYTLAAGG